MSRMQWITFIQILFNQLEQTHRHKLALVSHDNYLAALDKIITLLPLIEFYEGAEKTIAFRDVYTSVQQINSA